MTGRLGIKTPAVIDAAALGIGRAVNHPPHAREAGRRRAQRTGFERHIKIETGNTLRARLAASLADDQHLGVRGRIVMFTRAVAGPRHHAAALLIDEHGPDRHFAALPGSARLGQSHIHEIFVHVRTVAIPIFLRNPRRFG